MEKPTYDRYDPEVRNVEIETKLRDISIRITSALPEGWGFALEIFEFDSKNFFYSSNARREDIIKVLDEWKENLKKG